MGIPTHNLILLGASNLHRGFAQMIRAARRHWHGPLQVFAAKGHGRSYGLSSYGMGWYLPGIRVCGLYDAIQKHRTGPLRALVGDVGNDLLYGVSAGTVLGWVEEAFDRLLALGAKTVFLPMPIHCIRRLSENQYLFFRHFFYPRCLISHARMRQKCEDLNAGTLSAARKRGLIVLEHEERWYGWDPVHIARWKYEWVWAEALARLDPSARPARHTTYGPDGFALSRLRPLRCGQNLRTYFTPQPVQTLEDGSVLHLY